MTRRQDQPADLWSFRVESRLTRPFLTGDHAHLFLLLFETMRKRLLQALLLVGALAAPIFAAAAVAKIEIVVFERPGIPDMRPIADPGQPDPARVNPQLAAQHVPLARAEHDLGPIAYTLQRRGLPVRLHLAWTQPMRAWKSEDWQWLDDQQGLQGLLRVTKGRFIHLNTDLLLTEPDGQQYRVRLDRKMRSGELHHIDHPKLGLIARVTLLRQDGNAEPEPEASDESAGPESGAQEGAPPAAD